MIRESLSAMRRHKIRTALLGLALFSIPDTDTHVDVKKYGPVAEYIEIRNFHNDAGKWQSPLALDPLDLIFGKGAKAPNNTAAKQAPTAAQLNAAVGKLKAGSSYYCPTGKNADDFRVPIDGEESDPAAQFCLKTDKAAVVKVGGKAAVSMQVSLDRNYKGGAFSINETFHSDPIDTVAECQAASKPLRLHGEYLLRSVGGLPATVAAPVELYPDDGKAPLCRPPNVP